MDLYCPVCGEPWDIDSLHDESERRRQGGAFAGQPYDSVFKEVRLDFQTRGCLALDADHSAPSTATDRTFGLTRQDAAAALYELLGDDIDGAASELYDLGF